MAEKIISGFPEMDEKIQFNRGELCVLYARPAIGKTSFALSMFLSSVLTEQQRALYFSFSQNKDALFERMDLAVKHIRPSEEKTWKEKLRNRGEVYDEVEDLTEMILICAEQKVKYGLDFIVVDDILSLERYYGFDLKNGIKKFRELAKKLNITVFLIANAKGVYADIDYFCLCKDIPVEISRLSDKILELHRPVSTMSAEEIKNSKVDKYDFTVTTIKNRTGEYCQTVCKFIPEQMKFVDGSGKVIGT